MAKFDIKKLIEKHTKEDEVNYEAVNSEVNEQANNIIASKKPDMEALKEEAKNEFLSEYKFENVEAFKKSLEVKSSESSKELEEIKKQFEDYKAETKDYTDLKEKETASKRQEILAGTKITNKALLGALRTNAEKRLSNEVDFEQAVKLELDESPDSYTVNSNLTSGVSTKGGNTADGKLGFEKEIERITNVKL